MPWWWGWPTATSATPPPPPSTLPRTTWAARPSGGRCRPATFDAPPDHRVAIEARWDGGAWRGYQRPVSRQGLDFLVLLRTHDCLRADPPASEYRERRCAERHGARLTWTAIWAAPLWEEALLLWAARFSERLELRFHIWPAAYVPELCSQPFRLSGVEPRRAPWVLEPGACDSED